MFGIVLFGQVRSQNKNRGLYKFARTAKTAIYQSCWSNDFPRYFLRHPRALPFRALENYNLNLVELFAPTARIELYKTILSRACEYADGASGADVNWFLVTRPDIHIRSRGKLLTIIEEICARQYRIEVPRIFCGVYLHRHLGIKLSENIRGNDLVMICNRAALKKISKFSLCTEDRLEYELVFENYCKTVGVQIEYLNFLGNRDFFIHRSSRINTFASDITWALRELSQELVSVAAAVTLKSR